MLKIGICDMDAAFVEKLLDMMKDILYEYVDWEAQVFRDSNEVIGLIDREEFDCNLLFLDIYQHGRSGISVADYIKDKCVDTDIIFVTTSKDYVFDCYQSHTFAYMLKPIQESDIASEVKRYLKEMQLSPKCLNISNRGNVTRIPLETILYIESEHRKIIVHTKSCSYSYYQKLDALEKLLEKDHFIRCHQSYLVPLDKITAYNNKMLRVGDRAIPISRTYKQNVSRYLGEEDIAVIGDIAQEEAAATNMNETEYENMESDYFYLTSGVFQNNDTQGALVCVKGAYLGNIIRVVPEQTILVGRDGTSADMVVNLPLVSRTHCTLIYHEADRSYEVQDCSMNGTYVDGEVRLTKGETYYLHPGSTVSFGDMGTVYRLG